MVIPSSAARFGSDRCLCHVLFRQAMLIALLVIATALVARATEKPSDGAATQPSASVAQAVIADAIHAHSTVSMGDVARVQRVLAKARRGEPVTVAVIGGSITQGARATTRTKNYGSVLADWWRQTFPKTKIELINAGIGATGSNYGALRARRDLLSHKPDFVVMEYACNDGNAPECVETLEGLVRQTLKEPQQPAVVLLFMMHTGGGNSQQYHEKVGRCYRLPMVSFRDAFWPEIQAGRMKWEDIIADQVHPNDRGHAAAAMCVSDFLENVLKALPADGQLPEPPAIPSPLVSDLFEHVALLEAGDLRPVRNEGWVFDEKNKCWKSDRPGSRIEFEVEGKAVLLMDWHIRGPMGKAKVQLDDRAPTVRDAWFNQTWGGYRQTTELARGLAPGKHRITLEILPEKDAESTGNEYRLLGLGCAGVPE